MESAELLDTVTISLTDPNRNISNSSKQMKKKKHTERGIYLLTCNKSWPFQGWRWKEEWKYCQEPFFDSCFFLPFFFPPHLGAMGTMTGIHY